MVHAVLEQQLERPFGVGMRDLAERIGAYGIATFVHHPPTATALREAAAAGVLSSAVPFLADMLALRRVPARLFGVFMSVNPVLAALVGLVVLDQSLGWPEWLAIAAIVTANAVSVLATGRRDRGGSSGPSG